MTSTVPSIPLVPQPALTHNSHASPIDLTTNPVDDFFGYTLSWTPTRDSRHDRPTSEVLPAYVDDLPGYTQKAETPTLAQYLFKFGFCAYIFPTNHSRKIITDHLYLLQCSHHFGYWALSSSYHHYKHPLQLHRNRLQRLGFRRKPRQSVSSSSHTFAGLKSSGHGGAFWL